MKKVLIVATSLVIITTAYYFSKQNSQITVQEISNHQDYYSQNIQPIFNAKCIACHSCYNSPCQLNLTSYQSSVRGAHQISIYDFPKVDARQPTRMFIDAKTEEQWRNKGFYSILKKESPSILDYMISSPDGIESNKQEVYKSEESRVCIKNLNDEEVEYYSSKNQAGRMPYGLPALTKKEIETIRTWQSLGSPGPQLKKQEQTILKHSEIKYNINKWEKFFNRKGIKNQLSSRYIYEHLFLAHIYFSNSPNVFFKLVRSRTQNGNVDEIATDYPFDSPGSEFYYRFRPVVETIVHKSHLPFEFSDEKIRKWNRDFYEANWRDIPNKMPAYGKPGANPYRTFASIPVRSRYQFFLDEAGYHIMTFIKGPVCRGQTALNVINDHFWVMFLNPDHDPMLNSEKLYNTIAATMKLPAEIKDDFQPLADFRDNYWKGITAKYNYLNDKKLTREWIWNGDKDNLNANLTVDRHFDSAHVMRGWQGRSPKTLWVIDYQVFESIYYNLTAGYNVFGPILHQVNSRLFMEISRVASEDLFLTFLPHQARWTLRQKWNQSTPTKKESTFKWLSDLFTPDANEEMKYEYVYQGIKVAPYIQSNDSPKMEFIQELREKHFSPKQLAGGKSQIPKPLLELAKVKSKGLSFLPDNILVKYQNNVYTLVHHKDHYNVSMLFFENERRKPSNDSIDIIDGTVTSYANLFMVLDEKQVLELTNELKKANSDQHIKKLIKKYGVSREDNHFWKHYQYFSSHTHEKLTNESGYLDLNRYINL